MCVQATRRLLERALFGELVEDEQRSEHAGVAERRSDRRQVGRGTTVQHRVSQGGVAGLATRRDDDLVGEAGEAPQLRRRDPAVEPLVALGLLRQLGKQDDASSP